jgi:pimeloyl-ACP methyl ester carboxylesterase
MTTDILRTPDDRFLGVPDFDYTPRYVDDLDGYAGVRVHYVDTGGSGPVFLCLHGNPTWSFLYRRMIPVFAAQGRVVAPDLIGFGRSDKPVDDGAYSFDFHRGMLMRFIERLDLQDITLVCQDWGGIIGLTLPMEMPARFKRLLVMNTHLATGEEPLSQGFLSWRQWCAERPDLPVGKLHSRSSPHLTPAELAAYDAPFPDARYKAGVRSFPKLVPESKDDPGASLSRQARDWWHKEWQGESFMAVGMKDPVFNLPVMQAIRSVIRGCPEPMQIAEGGHFVQEWGDTIAAAALKFWGSSNVSR